MNDYPAAIADPSARFDQIEQLLKFYPDVTDGHRSELEHWFKKEASAFEVASLASKQPVAYEKFRADHIDKFSKFELLMIGAVTLAIFALIAFFL